MTLRPPESGWLSDTPVDDSLLRRFLFNQADVQDEIVRAVGGRNERTADVSLADAGSPSLFLNQATLLRPLQGDGDPALDDIGAYYRGRSTGLLVSAWPTPDLTGRGWVLVGHPMFVVRGPVDDAGPSPVDLPAGVSVRAADTAEDIAVVEQVVIEGYPIPELADRPRHSGFGAALATSSVVHRLGYFEGAPVAAAANHVGHGVVNLCLAATLPAARRRGVWQALVNARCADAPDLPAAAFTSDYSRPGFVRMGFQPILRFTLWAVVG